MKKIMALFSIICMMFSMCMFTIQADETPVSFPVTSVAASSEKIFIYYDNAIVPELVTAKLYNVKGDEISVTTDSDDKKTLITRTSDVLNGEIYRLKIFYDGNEVYDKYIKINLVFSDDGTGENVFDKWDVTANTNTVTYVNGKLQITGGDPAKQALLSAKDSYCTGNQTIEYTINWDGDSYDLMGFTMAKDCDYLSNVGNTFYSIASNRSTTVRVKCTDSLASDNSGYYHKSGFSTKIITNGEDTKIISIISNQKINIYRDDTLLVESSVDMPALVTTTSGMAGFRFVPNVNQVVTLDDVKVITVNEYDADDISDLNITNVYATSEKISVNYDGECIIDPAVTVTELDGTDVTPDGIETNTTETVIPASSLNYGQFYRVQVSYNGKEIYNKFIRRSLRFTDDCTGDNIFDKWDINVLSGDQALTSTDYVQYDNGAIKLNVISYSNLPNFQSILTPKDSAKTLSTGKQSFEYKIAFTDSGYDISSFSMSENANYKDYNSKNLFVKYTKGKTSIRHTYLNPVNAYWDAYNSSNSLSYTMLNSIIQVAGKGKIDVYNNGAHMFTATDCPSAEISGMENATVPAQGIVGLRVCSSNDQTIRISDIKVVDFVEFDSLSDCIEITTFAINRHLESGFDYSINVDNFSGISKSANVIVAFYDADDNMIGICINPVNEINGQNISGTVTVTGEAVRAKAFVWDDMTSIMPLTSKEIRVIDLKETSNIYVLSTGTTIENGADGSLQKPFSSIYEALEKCKAMEAANININILPGTYDFTDTISVSGLKKKLI